MRFIFFTTLAWNITQSKKNSTRHYHKETQVSTYPLILLEFNET
jgi:hypothetical protein